MKNNENFKCRGITKDNKFIFGYPIYSTKNKWRMYVSENDKKYEETGNKLIEIFVEIIQTPDRWTEKYDKDKVKIWENDKVYSNRKLMAYDSLKGESTIVYKNNTSSVLCFVMSLNKHYLESPLTDSKAKFLKVIGNVHNVIF